MKETPIPLHDDAAIAADWLRAFLGVNDAMRNLLNVSVVSDQTNMFDFEGDVLVLLVSGSESLGDDLAELRGDVEFQLEEELGRFVEVMAIVATASTASYLRLPVFDAVAAERDLIHGQGIPELRRRTEG